MNAAGIKVPFSVFGSRTLATFGWAQYRWKHEPVFYVHKRGKARTGTEANYGMVDRLTSRISASGKGLGGFEGGCE
ncbi:hypothetical protein GCM10010912_58330 [Paenibacillus albidus]|uniref:Uncharacterized protein n=1 Tax=Paenibacillus albidus TaxID=2041023 RepID=A0A917D3P0_9BACL|nr:hypothetical protein GCM10010912_58330 [Paenibacillus albidus]